MPEERVSPKINREAIHKALQKIKEEQTPLTGNKCHCGGQVVRNVRSLFRGRFYYSTPQCEKCGRAYLLAGNAPTRGEKEFREMLRKPFTI